MEIRNTIVIDNLTTDSVSVKTQRVLADGDQQWNLGEPVRTAYTKDEIQKLRENVPEPFLSAILEVWGALAENGSEQTEPEPGSDNGQNDISSEPEETVSEASEETEVTDDDQAE